MEKTRIGVVIDWQQTERGSAWRALLGRLGDELLPNVYAEYRLADLIREPSHGNANGHGGIRQQDVLIVNWDAANGDPDFGAHLAQRWIDHRRPEMLRWVSRGNILIVESQATDGFACQAAYDAAAGAGELPVSGSGDPEDPQQRERRRGAKCRKSRRFPKQHSFGDVPDTIGVAVPVSGMTMFPQNAWNLLSPHTREAPWGQILYRGWFRRTWPWSRRLPWVSLMETCGRDDGYHHSTLQVAKYGEGAIFATTVLLASTGQVELVRAMLSCAGKNTAHLPGREPIVEKLRGYWKWLLTLAASLFAVYFTDIADTLVQSIVGRLAMAPTPAQLDEWRDAVKALFVPAGMGLFWLAGWGFAQLRKRISDYIGI